jgi:hypothetical protein
MSTFSAAFAGKCSIYLQRLVMYCFFVVKNSGSPFEDCGKSFAFIASAPRSIL